MHMREVGIICGMTETSPVSTQTAPDDPIEKRVETIGRPQSHVEVKITDPATGAVVPRGTPGEQCTRGYLVMLGYWEDTDATAKAIDAAGWMHSGDLAVMDDDGYVRIVGRIKDVIIRGGENLSPQMIEGVLASHPAVRACCVVGAPHADLGEVPVAFVVLRAGMTATAGDLQALVGERLSRMYIPAGIHFESALPENSVGKIDRKALQIKSTQSGIN